MWAWLFQHPPHSSHSSHSSPPNPCSVGVPQGSVLGPLLFAIYTSPISTIANSHQFSQQQYADDTQLCVALLPANYSQNISELLQHYEPTRTLWSSSSFQLCVPRYNLEFGWRAFRISGPKIWNVLPASIHNSPSLPTFRRHLKTHYFQSAYPNP